MDEKNKNVILTDKGVDKIEKLATQSNILKNNNFYDPANLDLLNSIMHPLIYEMIKDRMKDVSGVPLVVVEAAVLIEANWQDLFDEIWVVTSDQEIVISRLAERNNLSRNDAISRIQSQMSQDERITHAHVEIDNSGTILDLEKAVKDIWNNKTS